MLAIYGSAAVVALIIIGLTAWALIRNTGGVEGITEYSDLSQDHVTGSVEYDQGPPVGGDHSDIAQDCGFYDLPIADEHAVHSLEHGAVWITYMPDLADDELKTLRDDMGTNGYVLMSPYEGQDSPVVLSAWGIQLKVDTADDPKVEQFLNKYVQGEQTLEPGAACAGTSVTGEEAEASLGSDASGMEQPE